MLVIVFIVNAARFGMKQDENQDPVNIPTETQNIDISIDTIKEIEIPSFEKTDDETKSE